MEVKIRVSWWSSLCEERLSKTLLKLLPALWGLIHCLSLALSKQKSTPAARSSILGSTHFFWHVFCSGPRKTLIARKVLSSSRDAKYKIILTAWSGLGLRDIADQSQRKHLLRFFLPCCLSLSSELGAGFLPPVKGCNDVGDSSRRHRCCCSLQGHSLQLKMYYHLVVEFVLPGKIEGIPSCRLPKAAHFLLGLISAIVWVAEENQSLCLIHFLIMKTKEKQQSWERGKFAGTPIGDFTFCSSK